MMKKLFLFSLLLPQLAFGSYISPPPASGSGTGNVVDINTDTSAHATLTVGTSGTDFAIADNAAGDHKFNLPDASATARGAVTTGAQTLGAGVKTFSSAPVLSALTASLPICTSAGKAASSTCTGLIPWADIATGNNYRLIATNGSGVPGEASAITGSKGLCSDANGIPVACTSGPSATEMTYLAGVTSAIQTQLNSMLVSTGFVEEWPVNAQGTSVANGTYYVIPYSALGRKVVSVRAACATSGTITVALKVDGTNITTCNGISVTSTAGTTTCDTGSTSTLAANSILTLVTSSNSTCTDFYAHVKTTRQ